MRAVHYIAIYGHHPHFLVASFIGKREKLVFRAVILGKIDRQGHYAISSEFRGAGPSYRIQNVTLYDLWQNGLA